MKGIIKDISKIIKLPKFVSKLEKISYTRNKISMERMLQDVLDLQRS